MNKTAYGCIVFLAAASCVNAKEHTIELHDYFFDPAELTIEAGDSVTWVNMGAAEHNVRADDDSFRCANGCDPPGKSYHGGGGSAGDPASNNWSFTRTFDDVGDVPFHCEVHVISDDMVGTLTVAPKQDDGPAINFGHTGSWFNPETDGQGFLVDVVVAQDPPLVFLYWFTFDTMAGGVEAQRWFTAIGNADADQPNRAVLDVRITTGGVFDASPPDPDTEVVGTAVIEFESCTDGTLTYDINLEGDDAQQVMGEIPITRLTPDVRCEQLAGADG